MYRILNLARAILLTGCFLLGLVMVGHGYAAVGGAILLGVFDRLSLIKSHTL